MKKPMLFLVLILAAFIQSGCLMAQQKLFQLHDFSEPTYIQTSSPRMNLGVSWNLPKTNTTQAIA